MFQYWLFESILNDWFLWAHIQVEKLIEALRGIPNDLSSTDVIYLGKSSIQSGIALQGSETMVNPDKTRSVILERIASEMNRLKFYVAHAKVCSSFWSSLKTFFISPEASRWFFLSHTCSEACHIIMYKSWNPCYHKIIASHHRISCIRTFLCHIHFDTP